MNHRRIYMVPAVLLLSLFLTLSGLGAKPVYATFRTIEVTKKDQDGNLLSGWQFKVYYNGTLERTGTTTSGKVSFSNLEYGTSNNPRVYLVCETIQSGWTPVAPTATSGTNKGCQSITLVSGSGSQKMTFVNQEPQPAIDITKYTNNEDANSPTGPIVAVGSTVTWKYVVKNTGGVPLSNVTVTDNKQGVNPTRISGDTIVTIFWKPLRPGPIRQRVLPLRVNMPTSVRPLGSHLQM